MPRTEPFGTAISVLCDWLAATLLAVSIGYPGAGIYLRKQRRVVGSLDEARALPPLPLEEWEDSKETLHRYCQIVGKVRMEYSPYRNHWWHVTLYVSTRGLATGPIPYGGTTFDIAFDLLANRLAVTTSEGGAFSFALDDLPVAEFYRRLFDGLGSLGIDASINTKPFALDDEHTLDTNTYHRTCDAGYVRRYHHVLTRVDQILQGVRRAL